MVRTSLLAGVVGVHAFQGTRWLLGGEVPGVVGRPPPGDRAVRHVRDRRRRRCRSRSASEGLWRKFAAAVGLDADDARFATNRERVAHRDDLIAAIEGSFATQPAEHWLDLLLDAGIPAGKVRSMDDVYGWEQVRSQGLVLEVDHPAYGALELSGLAAALRRQPVLRRPRDTCSTAALGRAFRGDPGVAGGKSGRSGNLTGRS